MVSHSFTQQNEYHVLCEHSFYHDQHLLRFYLAMQRQRLVVKFVQNFCQEADFLVHFPFLVGKSVEIF